MNEVEYDVVVYGSDQIWRRSNYHLFKGFSDVYFGAYPSKVKRKISYAASMGIIDVTEQDKPYLRNMLQNFNAISVREEGLKKLVEDLTKKSVSLVLDPVFLLGKEEWLKVNSYSTPAIQEKYIFFYQLTPSTEAIIFTNRLKAHYGYKVFEIRGRVEPLLFGDRYLQTASPIDFISLIQNAEIVVSTSLHGVAFALLFGKQFYALGMKNNSGRVQTLLDKLDISQRLLTDINLVNLEDKIDYKTVNFKLAGFKQQSQNYLIDSIGSDN
jgi:polysaccharide pyruvyl transferase WcaK-like protein